MRNSVFMTDNLLDPDLTNRFEPHFAPASQALQTWDTNQSTANYQSGEATPLTMFDWLTTVPSNRPRLVRFGHGMRGISALSDPKAILQGKCPA